MVGTINRVVAQAIGIVEGDSGFILDGEGKFLHISDPATKMICWVFAVPEIAAGMMAHNNGELECLNTPDDGHSLEIHNSVVGLGRG